MSTADTATPMAEPAVEGDERIVSAAVEVIDDSLPATVKSTALAPLNVVEAGIAALREKHGGKTYEIQTTKGYAEAKADRMAIRDARYKVPHIVKEQKAILKEVITDLEAYGEKIVENLLEIEQPITAVMEQEDERKRKAKEAAEAKKRAMSEAASTTINAIRDRITLAVGQTPAAIQEIITVCEAIEGSEEEYGDRNGEVLRARSETLAKLREMHAAQVQWEKTQAEAREKARKDALQTKIDAFGRIALAVIGKPSAAVQQAIADLEAMDITAETFAERANDAIDAQQAVLKQLDTLLTAAKATEAAAAQQAETDRKAAEARAENERLERQRNEQAAESQRQADEAKRQDEARTALAQQQQQIAQQAQTVANARTEQIAAAVLAIENAAALYSSGMSSEVLAQAVQTMKERKLGVAEFGSKIGVARAALAAAVEKVEGMLSEAIRRECAEAEAEAAALPPAAPPAPAADPAAAQADASRFFGMFESQPETAATPEPAPAPAAIATDSKVEGIRVALTELLGIVNASDGVIGYHKDGTVAEWDEFEEVTRAQMALKAFNDASEPAPF